MYFSWEGRLVSRVLINLLTPNKWIWNIINAMLITLGIYYGEKLINPQNKNFVLVILFSSFLLINLFTFSEVVVWLAGNITYLFPLMLILLYSVVYLKKEKLMNLNHLLLIILNIIIPMFVEHMGVLLVLINLILIGYRYIKTKKTDKLLLINLVISIVSISIMLLSPGTQIRTLIENAEFNKLNLVDKVFYNLKKFVYYTFISNYSLVILWIQAFVVLVKKKYKGLVRIILLSFGVIIPCVTIVCYFPSIIDVNIYNEILNSSNIYLVIYGGLSSIIMLYLIYQEHDRIPLLLFTLGMICNGIMLVSPTWGI